MADVESEKAVDAIITDIRDRRGLRQEWEAIDADIQAEIRAAWTRIVETARESARREAFEETARHMDRNGKAESESAFPHTAEFAWRVAGYFRALATGKGAG